MFMAAPIVFLGALGLAVAVLFGVTRFGSSTASGDRVTIAFNSSCMDSAIPLLTARAEQVGMPSTFNGEAMTTTLPAIDNARTLIPGLLATPGVFAVSDPTGTAVFNNKHIDEVAIDLDEAGMPMTLVKLGAGARADLKSMDGSVDLTPSVDGVSFEGLTIADLQEEAVVTLHSGEGITAERMKRAADLAIILQHGPLPCAVRISGVADAPNPG